MLRRLLRIQAHLIENPRNGGVMRALSADAALQHGLNPSANIIDELHAHRDGALFTALTTGTLAREQPFTLWITTAGARDSFLGEMYAILDGGSGDLEDRGSLRIYRDRANGILIWWYGAPDGADIEDPAVWRTANPASWLQDGRELRKEFERLRSRGALTEWRTYHLNQFVQALEAWLPADRWAACAGAATLDAREPTYASVRVARDHRSAAVAIAQRHGDGVVLRARVFESDDLVDGDVLDLAEVEAHLLELARRYPARVVAEVTSHAGGRVRRHPRPGPEITYHGSFFQRSRQLLEGQGLVLVAQPDSPARLAPAAAQLRGLVTERKLVHDGDPDLARHVGNVVVKETQAGAVPRLPGAHDARIDAALAAMHVVNRAMTAPRPTSRTVRNLR